MHLSWANTILDATFLLSNSNSSKFLMRAVDYGEYGRVCARTYRVLSNKEQ